MYYIYMLTLPKSSARQPTVSMRRPERNQPRHDAHTISGDLHVECMRRPPVVLLVRFFDTAGSTGVAATSCLSFLLYFHSFFPILRFSSFSPFPLSFRPFILSVCLQSDVFRHSTFLLKHCMPCDAVKSSRALADRNR